MCKNLLNFLLDWPRPYISYQDLEFFLKGTKASCYGIINRALKDGILRQIKRGIYFISLPNQPLIDTFELAQFMYGPSYVTKESALSFWSLIPEAVYAVTSACFNRSKYYSSFLGDFYYEKVSQKEFFLGVERISQNKHYFLMATPWRAIADLIYLNKKKWRSFGDLEGDMRIDIEELRDFAMLRDLVKMYPNHRVRKVLKDIMESL